MLSSVKAGLCAKLAIALLSLGIAGGLAGTSMVSAGHADDNSAQDKKESIILSDFETLKKYQSTGVLKRCISLNRVMQAKVLDDQTILFKMRGKKHYVNRMPHSCPSLKREERFMYKTTLGDLCSIDTITVLDSFGRAWASCGLGSFTEIETAQETADTPISPDAAVEK